ncbi:NgoMIV family type II restriction endonuclease [Actinomadura chokoriensis]|uniref:NgoMIV family type II restriction endonuclease n=1 Tax=Actinomadura chokoriensis TaxID=454156 RepID=A0ABV4QU16_9ACTN
MTAPFAHELLGWRKPRQADGRFVPNCADSDSVQSIALAGGMLAALGIQADAGQKVPTDPGPRLEELVRSDLADVLGSGDRNRTWDIARGRVIADFSQYEHLKRVDKMVQDHAELRVTLGQDYLIKPDVTVGVVDTDNLLESTPFLHAAVSCKWTIRSDRVQNIRHEFNQMIRHRRGRQPHLVTVTAEPLPSRIASITRGTGEIDAVYHIAFDALDQSVRDNGNPAQKAAWNECVQQRRLLSYRTLSETLLRW